MVVPADTTTPDLICNEAISENSSIEDSNQDSQDSIQDPIEDYSPLTPSSIVTPNSRSSSPLSAVDIFTEFNTNVLQPIFDQVETPNSFTSVLISTWKFVFLGIIAKKNYYALEWKELRLFITKNYPPFRFHAQPDQHLMTIVICTIVTL